MKYIIYIVMTVTSVLSLCRCSRNITLSRTLDQIAEKNVKGSDRTGVATPHIISGLNNKSKYDAVKELFQSGAMPFPGKFQKEEIMSGKCAFEFDPQVFYGDVLNTYVEKDPVLGTFIYAIPTVLGYPNGNLLPENYDHEALHEKTRRNLKSFSTLLLEYPKNSAFYPVTKEVMENAAYIYYKKEEAGRAPSSVSSEAAFRLRIAKEPQGSTNVIVLEHYCYHLEGCQFEGVEKKYNHLEPYAYCYFVRKTEHNLARVPANTKPPEAAGTDNQQDVLEADK